MTKKQIRLIAGVSMYCIMLCMAFAVRGLNPRPAELPEPDPPEITAQDPVELAHVVQTKPLVYRTPEAAPEPIPVTDPEPPLLNVIEHCTVTYYCAEQYEHICGTGDGITATGTEATPGLTCAVDPEVIPFGSIVMVDYGNGILHEYIAQDTGVHGKHVDLCVTLHTTALELGITEATVYWTYPEAVG